MKKTYVSPEVTSYQLQFEDVLTASLTNLGSVNEECDQVYWG